MVEGGRQRRNCGIFSMIISKSIIHSLSIDLSRKSATSVRLASQTLIKQLAELPRAETVTIIEKCSSAHPVINEHYPSPLIHHGPSYRQHDRRDDQKRIHPVHRYDRLGRTHGRAIRSAARRPPSHHRSRQRTL